ncbi:MAG TPA: folate-binding protein, partial [Anaeromyxobacter sp.]
IDLLVAADGAEALRAAAARQGATPLGQDDLEALRVLAGIARFGADMDPSRLPMEAGLTRAAISFGKGCYTGQEVVLRATVRGHLQRGLVQLEVPPGAAAGTPLTANGQEVGALTSVADTPEGRIALGYLRRAHWKEGERVGAGAGEAVVRKVIVEDGLPG